MDKNQKQEALLTQIMIELLRSKQPQSVQQLVNLVKEKTSLSEEKIIEHINLLRSEDKIRLKEQSQPTPQKLSAYIRTKKTGWCWITLLLATTTAAIVFTVPEGLYPLVYVRYILGTIFILLLPGYSFIRALFPEESSFKTSLNSLDSIERIALSIGMSLALVPIIGLILNYTSWGTRLTPIVVSLLALTTIFATAGIIREHQSNLKQDN